MNGLRFKIILLLVLLAAGAGMILFFNHEPRADGHPLSYWLREGSRPDDLDNFNTPKRPSEEVDAAVRKIGAQAVPALLAKLQAQNPKWREPVSRWVHEKLGISFSRGSADTERSEAEYGFRTLGTQAVVALPELSRLLLQTNFAPGAAYALSEIGPAAIPVIRAALTNASGDICLAASRAAYWSKDIGREVMPELTALLSRPERYLFMSVASQISHRLPPEEFIGLMTNVSGPNQFLGERLALRTLARTNINPTYAVPIVARWLDSPDPTLRLSATNTLRRIDPAVAFAHGVNTNPPTFGPGGRRAGRRGGN